MHFVLCTVECAEMRIIMEKAIRKYWPVFVLPTMAAFMIGFIVPFIEGIYLSFCKFNPCFSIVLVYLVLLKFSIGCIVDFK